MKITQFFTAGLVMFLTTAVFTSCETNGTQGRGGSGGGSESGGRFLATDYEPLDKWFEERFEVKYANMTPKVIFDQVPINDIKYQKENLPTSPVFELDSDNISRREILKEIADFWDLKMTIKDGPDGNPSYVYVKGRG